MQVNTEQIDPCKIALTITVEPEKVAETRERVFQQAAKTLQIPGFRRGKVPPHLARGYVDENRVLQRTAETLVPEAYAIAVAEQQIEAWAQADFEFVEWAEGGAFVFKALVPLRPQVTLGPYKGLALERRQLLVTDQDVERQIEQIRERFAEYPEVSDRPVLRGDVLLVDLQADVEGKELPELAEPRATAIEVGKNIPDFDDGLVGMTIGETKTIEAVYPDSFDDEAMRGKKGIFQVTVKEIRAKNVPDLTDELVQKAHPTAKTVDELTQAVRENLARVAAEMADNELEFNLVSDIVKNSQIHFPDVLLRAEMQADAQQLQERLERDKLALEDYLSEAGKTREEMEQEMAANASQRIRNSLILSEVARAESITVEDADIDAKIAERATQMRSTPAAVRALAEKNNQLDRFRDLALTEKILAFLKGVSNITQKEITTEDETVEAEPAPVAKTSRKPAASTTEVPKRPSRKKAEAVTEEVKE